MLFQLYCQAQTYDWGKKGSSSLVAQFSETNPDFKLDESTPYAELWMGSHPKAPSVAATGSLKGQNLREIIKSHPEVLGSVTSYGKDGDLPFLFKILSIGKALSIQAHPDKSLGAQLRARDPKNYPDDNHKPEMAIALTDFEGFCGFRPPAEIAQFLKTVPEFSELCGEAADKFVAASGSKEALKGLFEAVMTAPDDKVETLAAKLVKRAADEGEKFAGGEPAGGKPLADLIVRLNEQFPNDIGLFCGGLMLNYCILKIGEAMFLRAKDPHAYISGNIIECMAASDNVVRAGFTPKFKDVSTLVSMLTYNCAPVSEQKMKPEAFLPVTGGTATLFDPPIDEFSVLEITTLDDSSIPAFSGPYIFIVTEGAGSVTDGTEDLKYERGSVFFVGAGTKLKLTASKPTVTYNALSATN